MSHEEERLVVDLGQPFSLGNEDAVTDVEHEQCAELPTSSDRLLPNKELLSTKEVASFLPLSMIHCLNFIRRRWMMIGSLIILITVADVLIFFLTAKSPKINNIEIFFAPTNSDAEVTVSGETDKSSWTTSFDVSSASCTYAYRKNDDSDYSAGGELSFMFPQTTNTPKTFDVTVQAQDTDYDALRRIYWDFSTQLDVDSSVSVECSIQVTAALFHSFPTSYDYKFKETFAIEELKQHAKVKTKKHRHNHNSNDDDFVDISYSSRLVPGSDHAMTMSYLHYDLIVAYDLVDLFSVTYPSLKTLIIHLPKMAYATALVDRNDQKKSYLKVRTDAVTFDLLDSSKPLVVDIKVGCTPEGRNIEEARESDESCTLLSPLSFREFRDEFTQNKFVNVTAQSIHKNFLSMFLGQQHYIRSTDPANFPFSGEEVLEGLGDRRQLSTYHTNDPAISNGADCVTVDSDGVYISQACSYIEEGFFKLYIGIYNDDGFTGYLKSVTSWAPSGEVAFDSELIGEIVSAGTEYKVIGDVFFSEAFQNLTGVIGFNYSDTQAFLETLTANWNFEDAIETGILEAKSVTLIEGVQPIKAYALLDYGNDLYTTKVLISDSSTQELGDALTVFAAGAYGGNWYKWYVSLNESTLVYEQSTIGHATGSLHYCVPASAINGSIALEFDAVDSQYNTVTASNLTALAWYSDNAWSSSGNIVAISLYELLDGNSPTVTWNATGAFLYANDAYTIYAVENPLAISSVDDSVDDTVVSSIVVPASHTISDLKVFKSIVENISPIVATSSSERKLQTSADDDSAVIFDDSFLLLGLGNYGGDWYKWFASLNTGILVFNSVVDGYASGEVSYAVPAGGSSGQLALTSNVLNSNKSEVFENHGLLSWSTDSTWTSEGTISIKSRLNIYGTDVNWNTTGILHYEDSTYNLYAAENAFDKINNAFIVTATGQYGGSSALKWWVTLNEGDLTLSDSFVGSATGIAQVDIVSSGITGDMFFHADATDASDNTVYFSNQTVAWTTNNGWTDDGSISLLSQSYWGPSFNWNASGLFNYGDNKYYIGATENDFSLFGISDDDYAGDDSLRRRVLHTVDLLAIIPTSTPTARPTPRPTSRPSANPTSKPTAKPTSRPTNRPTSVPTNGPQTGDEFHVFGYGSYGASSGLDWWGTLDYSELVVNYALQGTATGGLSFDVQGNAGSIGTVEYTANVTNGVLRTVYFSDQVLDWSSQQGWSSDGLIKVSSKSIWSSWVNWNATGEFSYGDHQYFISAVENDLIPSNNQYDDDYYLHDATALQTTGRRLQAVNDTTLDEFYLVGYGGYGASNAFDWWTSVDFAELVYDHILRGTATGALSVDVDSSTGAIGDIKYNANVTGIYPTATPTPQPDTVLVMMSNMNINNVGSSELSGADQDAIINAAALAMGITNLYSNTSKTLISISSYYLYQQSYPSTQYMGYIYLETIVYGIADSDSAYNYAQSVSQLFTTTSFNNELHNVTIAEYNAQQDLSTAYSSFVYTYVSNVDDPTYDYPKYENVYYSNQSLAWSTNNGWLQDGSIVVQSQSIWDTAVNWDATGSFNYGSSLYSIMASEKTFGSEVQEFYVYGTGNYGGNYDGWFASLEQSTLIVSDSVLGHAIGRFQYVGVFPTTDDDTSTTVSDVSGGNVTYFAYVTDANNGVVLQSDDLLMWKTSSDWLTSGSVLVQSTWDLTNIFAYNATADFNYNSDNTYNFRVQESHIVSDSLYDDDYYTDDTSSSSSTVSSPTSILVYGNGQYGGNVNSDWFATLDESYLYYNDGLAGSAQGDITGITPSGKGWSQDGNVILHAIAKDTNFNEIFKSFDTILWQSNSSWIERGYFQTISQTWAKNSIDWNASASFIYGENAYKLNIVESALVIANDDDYNTLSSSSDSTTSNFLAMIQGGYGASGDNEGWLSVTNSLIKSGSTIILNMRAYLAGAYSYSGDNLAIIANIVDYTGEQPSIAYTPMETYPVSDSYLWTTNKLVYYYNSEQTQGSINTNTSWYSHPVFSLTSLLNVSFVEQDAYFMIYETLNGAIGLDAWAAADYDLMTGMIADIGGEVSYAETLIFGANTAYDMQLQDYHAPTMSPTVMPTYTLTISPSVAPTVAPTSISASPTVAPTRIPTRTPTAAPKVFFSASQPITGIDLVTYDDNYVANNAALQESIALCMTGAQAWNIQNLVVVGVITPTTSNLRSSVSTNAVSTDSIIASYVVNLPTSTATYSEISEQLTTNIQNGNFNNYLSQQSIIYNASIALRNASSTTVATDNLNTGSDDDNTNDSNSVLSVGAIVGIAIGGAALIALCIGLNVYYFYYYKKSETTASSGRNEESQNSVDSKSSSPSKQDRVVSGIQDEEQENTKKRDSTSVDDVNVFTTENIARRSLKQREQQSQSSKK